MPAAGREDGWRGARRRLSEDAGRGGWSTAMGGEEAGWRREVREEARRSRGESGKGERQLGFHHGGAAFYMFMREKTRMTSVGHENYWRWHGLQCLILI